MVADMINQLQTVRIDPVKTDPQGRSDQGRVNSVSCGHNENFASLAMLPQLLRRAESHFSLYVDLKGHHDPHAQHSIFVHPSQDTVSCNQFLNSPSTHTHFKICFPLKRLQMCTKVEEIVNKLPCP